jgi:hypothetical protein
MDLINVNAPFQSDVSGIVWSLDIEVLLKHYESACGCILPVLFISYYNPALHIPSDGLIGVGFGSLQGSRRT